MTIERETVGPVVADISNEIVRMVREHFGKGPTQAKTIWHDDVVVAVLRGGFTTAEQTLYRAGKGDVDLVINTPTGTAARSDGYEIRRAAIARGIACITTISGGMAATRAIAAARLGQPEVVSLQELHAALEGAPS